MDAWRAASSGDVYSVAAHVGDHLESINEPICDGQTLIFAAIFARSLSVLEYLLSHGADPNVFDDFVQTPLYVLVIQPGPEEFRLSAIVSLAMAGAALDKGRGGTGDTPLMACARHSLALEMEALLCWGAKIDCVDHYGCTALQDARGIKGSVELLSRRPQKIA